MKHHLNYLRLIFSFLLIVLVSSCEKDELTEDSLSSDTTETIQPEVKISSKPLTQFIEEDAKFKSLTISLHPKEKVFN